MGQVAIIGWGSLIWDLEILAPHVSGAWHMAAGPELEMEFSRISAKRNRALAVCLDAENGASCATNVITSARADCTEAILDLAARERTDPSQIGALCRRSGIRKSTSHAVMDRVEAWAKANGWTCAVWTDLASNYAQERGEPFSLPSAIAYLRGLEGDSLDEAVRYITQAPAATQTPLRRALAGEAWWQEEVARLGL